MSPKTKSQKVIDHEIEADVLVLGAGAAGCLASIGARERGAEKVVIVDKGNVISCGCAGAGQDHFGAQLNTGPEWDTDEKSTKYYSSPGWGVSSDLVEKSFTKEVRSMIDRLEAWGVEFYRNPDGSYYRSAGLGQPEWFLMMKNGKNLKIIMAKHVARAGVADYGQIVINKLLRNNGRAVGAVGFNRRTGEYYLFKAKSIVLALGAHQSRWYTNSTNMPYNIWQYPWNTGSQVVLPYEIGAKIKNLEQSVLTTLPKGFGTPGINGFQGMGAYFLNAKGERFMEKYHPLGERAPRGALIWGEIQELSEGRAPLFLDCRHIPEKELNHLIKNLLPVDKHTFNDWLEQRGTNLKKDLLEVELGEYSGGGNLHVDINMESVNLKGLFGLPFSGMLSTAMTGGLVAGREAAQSALKIDTVPNVDMDEVARERQLTFLPLETVHREQPKAFEANVRQVMEYYMGPKRSVKGMNIALHSLKSIEQHTDLIRANNHHELMQAQEIKHLVKYCQLIIKAVLMRRGMKGFYTVVDYPPKMEKELMLKNIILWLEKGEQKADYEDMQNKEV
jgi:succinate dehydrogenase/fumarate reductase flavoprotein subunit